VGNFSVGAKAHVSCPLPEGVLPVTFRVAEGLPVAGRDELQTELGLQVGLVETGKHAACIGWHEERIEIVGIAVERLVATGAMRERDGVRSRLQQLARNEDMLLQAFGLTGLSVHLAFACQSALEVYRQVAGSLPAEGERFVYGDGFACRCGNLEVQLVTNITDVAGPLFGQLARNTVFNLS
jgi:hypothetical protein